MDDFGISLTPKIHIITAHVSTFYKMKKNGLGIFSEQSGERYYHFPTIAWSRFKVSPNNARFGDCLKKQYLPTMESISYS